MKKGLCYRCEHRIKYIESGYAPRCECKETNIAVSGCYMYSPVLPLMLFTDKNDDRSPLAGSLFSSRSYVIEPLTIDDMEKQVAFKDDAYYTYWIPIRIKWGFWRYLKECLNLMKEYYYRMKERKFQKKFKKRLAKNE